MASGELAGGVVGITGMARNGSSRPNPSSAFAQKGRRASSPEVPVAPGMWLVATARARTRASAKGDHATACVTLGLRILGEGPAEDEPQSGDPRWDA